MKLILICCTLITCLSAAGQYAIINDPDGYINVREGKGVNTKIVGKLYKDDVFLCSYEPGKDQWASIYYNADTTRTGHSRRDIQGYVHMSRVLLIDSLRHISLSAKHRVLKENELIIQNDSIKITIRTIPFNAARHKVKRTGDGYVQKIDGSDPKGVDGELPTVELSSIQLTINGIPVTIPAKEYRDLYQPGLESFNVYFDKAGTIYLYAPLNSDGAGFYASTWIVRNGQYIKRYVDDSD